MSFSKFETRKNANSGHPKNPKWQILNKNKFSCGFQSKSTSKLLKNDKIYLFPLFGLQSTLWGGGKFARPWNLCIKLTKSVFQAQFFAEFLPLILYLEYSCIHALKKADNRTRFDHLLSKSGYFYFGPSCTHFWSQGPKILAVASVLANL